MDTFDKLKNAVKQRKEQGQKRHEHNSKDRLLRIIKKKLETTFIGDIAAIEESLGYLWGIDFEDKDLTENEEKLKKIWFDLRNNILDRGNAQIRGIKSELEQYTINFDGYNYHFNTRNP